MAKKPTFITIDDYLATVSPQAESKLTEIRKLIRSQVPDAQELISYQMPAFKQQRTFIYFAAFKKHIGVYPPVTEDKLLKKATERYRNDKGNLAFPLNEPMPYELIGRVAVALSLQYSSSTGV